MLRLFGRALALALLVTASSAAQTLEIPTSSPSPLVPDGWTILSKNLSWDAQGLFVRARTEGNCRIEYQEICYPAPGGGTICRKVAKNVCDEKIEKFRFGPELVMVEDKWAYLVRSDGSPVVFGEGFKVIPYRDIVMFRGASLKVDATSGASLVLDLEKLGQSVREHYFLRLYAGLP